MTIIRSLPWIAAAVVAFAAIAVVARQAQGGTLDPEGPPAPTGPLQAVLAQPTPHAIQVAQDMIIPNGQEILLPWLDVRTCGRIVAFAEASLISPNLGLGAAIIDFKFRSSVNGIGDFGAVGFSGQDVHLPLAPYDAPVRGFETIIHTEINPRSAPYLSVLVDRASHTTQPADASVSVWFYCD